MIKDLAYLVSAHLKAVRGTWKRDITDHFKLPDQSMHDLINKISEGSF